MPINYKKQHCNNACGDTGNGLDISGQMRGRVQNLAPNCSYPSQIQTGDGYLKLLTQNCVSPQALSKV